MRGFATLAGIATLVSVTAVVPARAQKSVSWFDANVNCETIEQTYGRYGHPELAVHTPDEMILQMKTFSRYGDEIRDRTAEMGRKLNRELDPSAMRMVDFGGPHGVHAFTNDLQLCLVMAREMYEMPANHAYGARPGEIPLCPRGHMTRDGCQR
jgi:hypothetical protein